MAFILFLSFSFISFFLFEIFGAINLLLQIITSEEAFANAFYYLLLYFFLRLKIEKDLSF